MAKSLYFYLIVALLYFSGTMSEVDAQKRCIKTLDPNNCVLSSCKQTCFTQYKGNGVCIAKSGGQSYRCDCVYNCGEELSPL
uniref:Knottin scorpion toxin-like domain-containing protein n=1 Tax=Daucus carota subsp. sativus TaxID=79200 RepID=A0A164ZQC4_DAUCS